MHYELQQKEIALLFKGYKEKIHGMLGYITGSFRHKYKEQGHANSGYKIQKYL